ncbi:hypothetical protein Nepgr_033622 [Nepenthes gracilis]|uniref:Uncharacterized protein n=1 Tax=Nepenthes gracilis TaxID=150966 RepID=A0AAD3TMM6_NEPGR|nr:hypothetical protein Nepgr_033622 [Nepenthes gracilis]
MMCCVSEWCNSVLWDSMAGLLTSWFAAVGVLGAADFCVAPFHSKLQAASTPVHGSVAGNADFLLSLLVNFECLGAAAMWALSSVRLLLWFSFEELVGFLLHLDIDCGVADVQPSTKLMLERLLLSLDSGCCAPAWACEWRAGLAVDGSSGSLRAVYTLLMFFCSNHVLPAVGKLGCLGLPAVPV